MQVIKVRNGICVVVMDATQFIIIFLSQKECNFVLEAAYFWIYFWEWELNNYCFGFNLEDEIFVFDLYFWSLMVENWGVIARPM